MAKMMLQIELPEFVVLADYCPATCCGGCCPPRAMPDWGAIAGARDGGVHAAADEEPAGAVPTQRQAGHIGRRRAAATLAAALSVQMGRPVGLYCLGLVRPRRLLQRCSTTTP
jgi:hypothetical protein